MKKTIALLLLLTTGWAATANAQWPQTTDHNPWSLEIGAKIYDRMGDQAASPLITDSITKKTLFDSEQATDLGTAAAAEVKFNFHTQTGQELEIRSILANWEEESGPFFGPNLESPFFPPGIVPDQFEYGHDSDFYSFEIMGRQAVRPGMVLMFGPRVVSTKDAIRLRSQATITPGGGVPAFVATSTSTTEATNILMGLQGGLEINRPVTPAIYGSGFIRVGGYYNPTEVTTEDSDPIIGTVTNRLTKSTGSFLGEVGGRLNVDIVPNVFSGYVGYEANWIDGIALAPAQFPLPTPASVDTANTVFFHGVTFGLKFTY